MQPQPSKETTTVVGKGPAVNSHILYSCWFRYGDMPILRQALLLFHHPRGSHSFSDRNKPSPQEAQSLSCLLNLTKEGG